MNRILILITIASGLFSACKSTQKNNKALLSNSGVYVFSKYDTIDEMDRNEVLYFDGQGCAKYLFTSLLKTDSISYYTDKLRASKECLKYVLTGDSVTFIQSFDTNTGYKLKFTYLGKVFSDRIIMKFIQQKGATFPDGSKFICKTFKYYK